MRSLQYIAQLGGSYIIILKGFKQFRISFSIESRLLLELIQELPSKEYLKELRVLYFQGTLYKNKQRNTKVFPEKKL